MGTYLVAREVAPQSPGLALGAAAVTAFNPHFILISSVINNDAAAACLGTLTLWAAIRQVTGTRDARSPWLVEKIQDPSIRAPAKSD